MKGHIREGLDMYWGRKFELLELVTQVRCTDPWFQEVLKELRSGRLSEENYNLSTATRRSTQEPGIATQGVLRVAMQNATDSTSAASRTNGSQVESLGNLGKR